MIIDLKKFITAERPYWDELDRLIQRQENDPYRSMNFDEVKRLLYLYQRASADLAKISTFSAERTITDYLEALVGKAYANIHAKRQKPARFSPWRWFGQTFPRIFRSRWRAIALSLAVMLIGCLFGGGALWIDQDAKAVLMPFEHLQIDPSQRVAEEEKDGATDRLKGFKNSFSAYLMTHNTRVSIFVLALGMTWGIGTVVLLFTNGVILGAVAMDYIQAGQTTFLMGWLLPHGAVEIPAVLLAGQAGLILAGAMIDRRSALPLGLRLRRVGPDVVHIIGAVAVLLIWAGMVEAFLSQYHEPVLPYGLKIAFGAAELVLLAAFLAFAGNRSGFIINDRFFKLARRKGR